MCTRLQATAPGTALLYTNQNINMSAIYIQESATERSHVFPLHWQNYFFSVCMEGSLSSRICPLQTAGHIETKCTTTVLEPSLQIAATH